MLVSSHCNMSSCCRSGVTSVIQVFYKNWLQWVHCGNSVMSLWNRIQVQNSLNQAASDTAWAFFCKCTKQSGSVSISDQNSEQCLHQNNILWFCLYNSNKLQLQAQKCKSLIIHSKFWKKIIVLIDYQIKKSADQQTLAFNVAAHPCSFSTCSSSSSL